MNFIVYSKQKCPHCYKIKSVLELCGAEYQVNTLDEDFTREEFIEKFGEGSTFPQVIADGKLIGGAEDTVNYLRVMHE